MNQERMAELLCPFLGSDKLSQHQLELVADYLELLIKWNSRINLTAIRDPEAILTRHFGESLFAARQLLRDSQAAHSVADVGSGAGFPGVPFKIWASKVHLTLIDSHHKKAAFLNEVRRRLNFSEVAVLPLRVEEISGQSDVVTLRAVEKFERMLPGLPRLMKPSGQIGLLIGESQLLTARATLREIRWSEPLPIPLSRNRILLIGRSGSFS
jgi:16S rRNA (guanine527-N7)-methyltransferase